MPRPYSSLQLRRLVAERADYLCEYCLIPEADSLGCEIDHWLNSSENPDQDKSRHWRLALLTLKGVWWFLGDDAV